jgi:hypothetical protein
LAAFGYHCKTIANEGLSAILLLLGLTMIGRKNGKQYQIAVSDCPSANITIGRL